MEVLVKTADLSREEWLRWRTKGIGGSDASIIAGFNPYKSVYQLWQEKRGMMPFEEAENDFTHFGTVLEPVVKREFMLRTGLKVRAKKAILRSSEYPFMLADLDGVIYEFGRMCIFEAKTASAYKQGVWEEGVPGEYMLQIQHYMAVTGAEKAYIAALVGGNHFFFHEVLRDEEMIRKIISMEAYFWENYVLAGKEPPPDGSKATASYLNKRYGISNGKSIELPGEALSVFQRYDEITGQLEELSARKEAVCNELKYLLKENEEGTAGERKVTWKEVKTTSFDRKRLKEEEPEIYGKYIVAGSCRRLHVA